MDKKYTRDQIKDAIWQELKESDYTGENNDRAYEVIGIVMAGIDKIVVSDVQIGAVWVKANSPDIKNGEYVAKFKAPGIKLKHDFVGMAFVDDQFVHFVCPCHYDLKWAKGHEELQFVTILDESAPSGEKEQLTIAVFDFIRDCATNWDHDIDSHKYDMSCRMCAAKKLYDIFKQQKEKQ